MTWQQERDAIQQQRGQFIELLSLLESGAPVNRVEVMIGGFHVTLTGGAGLLEWVESQLRELSGKLETIRQRARISGESLEVPRQV